MVLQDLIRMAEHLLLIYEMALTGRDLSCCCWEDSQGRLRLKALIQQLTHVEPGDLALGSGSQRSHNVLLCSSSLTLSLKDSISLRQGSNLSNAATL